MLFPYQYLGNIARQRPKSDNVDIKTKAQLVEMETKTIKESELPESDSNLLKYAYQDWVLLNHRSPTHQTVTHRPLTTYSPTNRPLTHRPTDPQSSTYVKVEGQTLNRLLP